MRKSGIPYAPEASKGMPLFFAGKVISRYHMGVLFFTPA